jgi:hypothetical protein
VVQYGMMPIWNCRLSMRNLLNNRSLLNSSKEHSSLEFVSTGMNHKRKQPLRVNPLHPFSAGVYSDRKTWLDLTCDTNPTSFISSCTWSSFCPSPALALWQLANEFN